MKISSERRSSAVVNHMLELRESLLLRVKNIRAQTEFICTPLEIEDYVIQTSLECSPTKWHLAHTTWFFETFVLNTFATNYRVFNTHYGYLFNSYYNTIGDRVARDKRGLLSRPTVEEVNAYRHAITEQLLRLIENVSAQVLAVAAPIITLGLNHEQQHQELILTDVKTVLALNLPLPVYNHREVRAQQAIPLKWHSIAEGIYEVGYTGKEFAFDNESPTHKQYLPGCTIANRLVTNGEYLEFMQDGAYERHELWLADGLAKANTDGWQAPLYWQRESKDQEWQNFTLQGLRAVDPVEPVTHISYYEADAFATWYGARIATEFDWEAAAKGLPIEGNFAESQNYHTIAPESNDTQLHQMFGDAWEWTRSAYLGYPGYAAAKGALGEYNGKFMSNQMVLRGGSCVTPSDHVRPTYRNFFPPEARWQFSGIRLAI